MIEFDYSKLRGKIRECGLTIEEVARKTGISKSTLVSHMSKGTGFRAEQAVRIARVLQLEVLEPYFLAVKPYKK